MGDVPTENYHVTVVWTILASFSSCCFGFAATILVWFTLSALINLASRGSSRLTVTVFSNNKLWQFLQLKSNIYPT